MSSSQVGTVFQLKIEYTIPQKEINSVSNPSISKQNNLINPKLSKCLLHDATHPLPNATNNIHLPTLHICSLHTHAHPLSLWDVSHLNQCVCVCMSVFHFPVPSGYMFPHLHPHMSSPYIFFIILAFLYLNLCFLFLHPSSHLHLLIHLFAFFPASCYPLSYREPASPSSELWLIRTECSDSLTHRCLLSDSLWEEKRLF